MNIQKTAQEIINSGLSLNVKIRKLADLLLEIPYKRIGSLDPEDMFSESKGSCTPKHVFFAKCLKKLGVEYKFLIIPFYYKNIQVLRSTKFSEKIQALIQAMPISYHIALKVKISEKWSVFDVTWDSKLKGFPCNDNWDGFSDMKFAVVPEDIIEMSSDPRSFEKSMGEKYSEKELGVRKEFYLFFDWFLVEKRGKA